MSDTPTLPHEGMKTNQPVQHRCNHLRLLLCRPRSWWCGAALLLCGCPAGDRSLLCRSPAGGHGRRGGGRGISWHIRRKRGWAGAGGWLAGGINDRDHWGHLHCNERRAAGLERTRVHGNADRVGIRLPTAGSHAGYNPDHGVHEQNRGERK